VDLTAASAHGRCAALRHHAAQHAGRGMPPSSITKRLDTVTSMCRRPRSKRRSRLSLERLHAEAHFGALLANINDVLDTLLAAVSARCPHRPDLGARSGQRYLPQGWTVEQWDERRATDPAGTTVASSRSMAHHVECLLRFKDMGIPVFDYGNNIRQVAREQGIARAFDIPGFVPEYIRPLFCRGIGPFRWAALSGDPADIARTDARSGN